MIIGDRLRALRIEKNFSQGEIEKRTGLLRAYISRVDNGHTVPNIETLENGRERSKFPSMYFSTRAKSLPIRPKYRSERAEIKSRGAILARTG
jgi:transcriptional regulator with XRE-family HTH domain